MSSVSVGLSSRRRARRFPIIAFLSWTMLAVALGLFFLELVRFSQQNALLSSDVSIAGVRVGGLPPVEAITRVEQTYAQPVTLWFADSPIQLDPAAIGWRTNRETMLAGAQATGEQEAAFWTRFLDYLLGRQRTEVIDVPLVASYQEEGLRAFIDEIAQRYDRPASGASFDLATLTTRPGAAGYVLDTRSVLPMIDAALRSPTNREVILPVSESDSTRAGLATLREMVIGYLDSEGFIYDGQSTIASVFVMDLQTGQEMSILGDVAVSAASTIKVGILIDYFRSLTFAPSQDEAFLMVQSLLCSNNSSSNLIMQIIGGDNLFNGIAEVNNTLQYVGARNTYISAPLYLGGDQVLGSIPPPTTNPNPNFSTAPDPFNQTTTEDLGTLLSLIYDCAYYGSGLMAAYPNGEFTQNECRQMLNIMSSNDLNRLLQAGIPSDVTIAHKNGWLDNVHGDAGIVFSPNGRHYVIAVYVWENSDFFSYSRAWPLVEGISRAAWNYFNPELPLIAPRTDIPEYAQDCNLFSPPYGEVNLDDINAWRLNAAS
ncbi:MAG: serine hydrolase [bacterium]|nr:serine hydrolase [bacterium]